MHQHFGIKRYKAALMYLLYHSQSIELSSEIWSFLFSVNKIEEEKEKKNNLSANFNSNRARFEILHVLKRTMNDREAFAMFTVICLQICALGMLVYNDNMATKTTY